MSSDIAFSFSADEKDVQRALQNLVKENAKLRAEITSGVNESKAAAAQEREWAKLREKTAKEATQQMSQLNAAAQRIRDSVATPFEEAKKKTAELRDHLNAGRISVDEYRLAYVKVAKELKEATRDHAAEAEAARAAAAAKADASRKAADAEREHAAAMREADAITQKLMTKEERYSQNVAKLNSLKDKGVLSVTAYSRALEAERKALEDTGNAADKSGGLMGLLTSKMATFVGGFASMSAAIAVIRSEYDALIERQGKSADTTIALGGAQENLINNLGGANAQEVLGQVTQLSRNRGIKEEVLTQAVTDTLSARGAMGIGEVMSAVGSVSKVKRLGSASEMAGLSAAVMDTRNQTGLSTDEALGFLFQMQDNARTKSLDELSKNVVPNVGGIMKLGASRETAGALLAALSHGMGDSTGQTSSTAGLQLADQLRRFAPGQDIVQTLSEMQQSPEMRQKFMSNASFEVKARPSIEGLLSGQGKEAKDFATFQTAMTVDPVMRLRQAETDRNQSGAIKLAELDQAFANAADQQKLASQSDAESGVIRRRMEELRKAMPGNQFSKMFDGLLEDLQTGGMQSVDRTMQKLRTELQFRQEGRSVESEAAKQSSSPLFEAISSARNGNDGRTREQQIRDENLRNEEFKKQTELLSEMVQLLDRQLGAQQRNVHAGAAVGRRNNQGEGGP